MLNKILGASLPVINQHHINIGNPVTCASAANNKEPLPISVMTHTCSKRDIRAAYTKANPHPRSNRVPQSNYLMDLSAFLQHKSWPMCTKTTPCSKPTLIHKPDLCIVFEESNAPNGYNSFHLPILICEIEGAKDVLRGKQESKAVEEACYSLPFFPENYVVFVYEDRWEMWVCKRNPHASTVDIQKEITYIQQDSDTLRDNLFYLTKNIIKIIIKQITTAKTLIDIALPAYRQNGYDGINNFHPYTNTCLTCWLIPHPMLSSQYLTTNPNDVPQFE